MTTIIGKVENGKVVIAGDSRFSTPTRNINGQDLGKQCKKVHKIHDQFGYGNAGILSEMTLFYNYTKNRSIKHATEIGILDFMYRFGQWAAKYNNGDPSLSNEYLIYLKGKLFYYAEDEGINTIDNFWVIGSGETTAFPLLKCGHSVGEALDMAKELDPHTGGLTQTIEFEIPK